MQKPIGQLILTSWGYTSDLPADNEKLLQFGNSIKDSIERASGRTYTVGPAGVIFYAAGLVASNTIQIGVLMQRPSRVGYNISHSNTVFKLNWARTVLLGWETAWELLGLLA